ncbi:MAG: hypothetical protein E7317_00580 [Clostridiales bacterium]|nr:hypothetical protein [Clostridiales bacterium]
MNFWMIATIVLALACIVLAILWIQEQRSGELHARQLENERRASERSLTRLKSDQARRAEEMALLRRELEILRDRVRWLEKDVSERAERYRTAVERGQREEKRRMAAERDLSAVRMREDQLEKQRTMLTHERESLLSERTEMERFYSDLLRESEETIVKLQGTQARHTKRKAEVLEDQVTLEEAMGQPPVQ